MTMRVSDLRAANTALKTASHGLAAWRGARDAATAARAGREAVRGIDDCLRALHAVRGELVAALHEQQADEGLAVEELLARLQAERQRLGRPPSPRPAPGGRLPARTRAPHWAHQDTIRLPRVVQQ